MSGVTKASSKLGKRLPILMGAILWWSFHTWVLNDWFGFEVTLSAWVPHFCELDDDVLRTDGINFDTLHTKSR